MKKKVLLSSLVTIVLCLCLIAGSTFALFTSTSQVNIAVTSGKVTMTASLDELTLYSAKGDAAGALVDENGNTYSYEEKDNNTFTNGGTAVINAGTLTMELVTPGDKVSFQVLGANTSNVAIQYRYIIECTKGWDLAQGMIVTVNEAGLAGAITTEALSTYTSAWTFLAVGADINPVTIDIELPISAGNEYQELETEYKVTVEAVQSNAVVEDNVDPVITTIELVSDATELTAMLTNDNVDYVIVMEDMDATIAADVSNKYINANGKDVALKFTGNLDNVVVANIVDTNGNADAPINVAGATGNITIVDSTLTDVANGTFGAIVIGANVDVMVDNCEFYGIGKSYGIRGNASGDLVVTNSNFYNFGSWAIIVNGCANGDVTVDNCSFTATANVGVFKTLGDGITGNFVFTNNTMNVPGDGGNIAKVVVSGSSNGPIICAGTVTSANNTLNGTAWDVTVAP